MEHSRKKLNLIGQRFGKLTVLAPAENIGGRTAWRCRCDCGQERVVKTTNLRSGRTTNCGCVRGLPPPPEGEAYSHGEPGRASLTYIDGTCVEVLRAKTIRSNNKSGVTGVEWLAAKGSWRASICFKGQRHYLGSYRRFEDAVRARKRAEEDMHDRFLREVAAGSVTQDGRSVG